MGKNILHVVNIYFTIPYFLGDQLVYFNEKGYKEHIICSPSEEIEKYSKIQNFDYKEVNINRRFSIKDDIKAIKKTCEYIKEKKIDIIVGHTPKGALIAMAAGWLCNIKKRIYFRHGLVYETSHGIKRKILISIERIISKLATIIINVSPSVEKKSLEEKLNGSNKQFILFKGTCNGISIDKFNINKLNNQRRIVLRNKLKLDEKSFIIGYSGRLVKDKGIIELIEALQILTGKNLNIKLLLVGMLEEKDALPLEIIEEIKNNPNIIHVGYVSYEVIEYYYSLMDVFILPSYREGFPTSVLEASAMNVPIITTRVTGCIDSIIENRTGVFVEHNSVELADAINFFMENNEERISYGNEGRKFVTQNFASEIIWKEIEQIYQD